MPSIFWGLQTQDTTYFLLPFNSLIQATAALVLSIQSLCWIIPPAVPLERHQLWKCWQTEKAAESFLMKIRKLFLLFASCFVRITSKLPATAQTLPPLEIHCWSVSCQKLTDCPQIKCRTEAHFYSSLHLVFICQSRLSVLRVSQSDLHCSGSCRNVVESKHSGWLQSDH